MKKFGIVKKFFAFLFGILYFVPNGYSQESVKLSYNGSGNYILVERTDLRRYDNGRYVGLMSREVRSFITAMDKPETVFANVNPLDKFYDGNFYVIEGTKRSGQQVASGIHDSIPSVFKISKTGELSMIEDNGYPSFRGFPSYPEDVLNPGDKWQSYAIRAVDPLNKGIVTKMPILVEYTFVRSEMYRGEDVFRISAKWATRYGGSIFDAEGDGELKSAMGSHSANILVSKKTGNAILVHDSVNETFSYFDGKQVNFKGTISLFTEYPPVVDKTDILEPLAKLDSIKVEKTAKGLMLTIENLRFKPDSAELLPGEEMRLMKIAEILRNVPKSMFLVEGHTASTGNVSGEQRLSEERAKSIAMSLANTGISADRFICKGSGSKKPIASNSTKEGMALNRRVEITILE